MHEYLDGTPAEPIRFIRRQEQIAGEEASILCGADSRRTRLPMKPNSLRELYVEQLKDLYDAEHQITKALPKMIDAAQTAELKDALTEHLDATKEQVHRLEQIFKNLGEKPKAEKCKGMQGILEEGNDLVTEIKDDNVRDAAIIASAQRVEHYEIAGYGTARTYAELLDQPDAEELLRQTLNEEEEVDQVLTSLAEDINREAMSEQSAEEAEEQERRSRSSRTRRAA
jgi:ferritin-like metal-binding protein YciE